MLKKTTFMLVAIGVFCAANQASAQTARFNAFKIQSAISAKKICVHNKIGGVAVRDSYNYAIHSAILRWKSKVRRTYGSRYAILKQARNTKSGCRKDRIEQNYRCYVVGVPCAKSMVATQR